MRHRIATTVKSVISRVLSVALRIVVSCLVFATCVVMLLRYLGVPMPSPYELLHNIDGLSSLAKILT